MTVDLEIHTEALPRINKEVAIANHVAPQAIYQHFDRMLTRQGFARSEGPLFSEDAPADRHPTSVAYERTDGNDTDRVHFNIGPQRVTITIARYARSIAEAKLPTPDETVGIVEHGLHSKLFALPGANLVKEEVVIRSQVDVPVLPSKTGANPVSAKLWVPMRAFSYVFAQGSAPEISSAWRRALLKAGWTTAEERPMYAWNMGDSDKFFRYKLSERTLEVSIRVVEDGSKTQAWVYLIDANLWPTIAAQLQRAQEMSGKPWNISPKFSSDGKAAAATQMEMFIMSAHLQAPERASAGERGIVVIPAVPASAQGDANAVAKAQEAAVWVRSDLVRRTLPAEAVRVLENGQTTVPQGVDSMLNVWVMTYSCSVKAIEKPGSADRPCECRTTFGQIPATAKACK
ncbi:MAG: hypothetical protein A3H93_04280 [Rhodocyclales bacterium RIFCSPLOWO2_02_FULL_63_24]|nr:MAG: hypothetical protein A3H93_04280 [Rhodocyclales bacterium RIFCSPLOWO2_02_FULL_63_24]